jgi:hypothetical protein
MSDKILRHGHTSDTAANWRNNNPILGKGEIAIESDTGKFKFGDGLTNWLNLPYANTIITTEEGGFKAGSNASVEGGGAIGSGANSKTGFSGGINSISENGGAIGLLTETKQGGAIGAGAKSENGFAGGNNANTVDGGSTGFAA